MAIRGASGALTGYDYQMWFIASKIANAFLNDSVTVRPEARIINESIKKDDDFVIDENIKQAIVDDVIVYQNGDPTFYNIKYIAPSIDKWRVSDLDNQGVLKQIVDQFKAGYSGSIVFVSQSSCYLFEKVFNDVKGCKTVKGLNFELGANKKNKSWKEWKEFKKRTQLTDKEALKLSKIVRYQHGYSINDYKENIYDKFKDRVINDNNAVNSIYQLTINACINAREINKRDIIDWFEKDKIYAKSILAPNQILSQFKKVSSSLRNWPDTFSKISESHIDRDETEEILNWIRKPLTGIDKPILLVVGNAGTGKTVILKDVLTKLYNEGVAAVALKADLYSAGDFSELKDKLNIPDDFEKLITTLTEKRKTVLLVDQIDALSQTLSSEREAINFYYNLINRLSNVPNLKIIVSCRTYDLSFDPILQPFDVKEKINVSDLSKEQIEYVIKKLGIKWETLPQKLKEILGNVQNLNIFASIYDEKLLLDELKSLEDLYSELWERKILKHKSETNDLINLISEISTEMYNSQKIFVSRNYYNDRYLNQLKQLTSEGILVLTDKKRFIQFFHQSFFDYCFARTFVSSRKNLYEHILKQHQGLFIRSLIKQVISYLRGANPIEYLSQLEKFLKSEKIRFHIKQMLINQLGFEENPNDGEWRILKKYVLNKTFLTRQFLEANRSCAWFDMLEKQGLVDRKSTRLNSSHIPLSRMPSSA